MIFSHVLYQLSYLAVAEERVLPAPFRSVNRAGFHASRAALTAAGGAAQTTRAKGGDAVTTRRDRQPPCGFCDGTGLWAAEDGAADPCPLCEGTGLAPGAAAPPEEPAEVPTLAQLQAALPRLTQAERQRLYEELHARYDCRVYR